MMDLQHNDDEANDVNKTTNDESIIGLEVDGRVFYCSRRTLTSGSATGSYFARRFSGLIPPGAMRLDEYGRRVYLVEADAELFEKYILNYLRRNHPGRLPPFSQDPEVWRALRREADFFGLNGLSELLQVTYTCYPHAASNRGILYWLGTEKGTRRDYQNPHETETIHVGGAVDLPLREREQLAQQWGLQIDPDAASESSRKSLVEHRPPIKGISAGIDGTQPPGADDLLEVSNHCNLLWCSYCLGRIPAVVDLKTISVRLTHYSMRYAYCYGMSTWNLEGSQDGNKWNVLHEARDDLNLQCPSSSNSTKAFCEHVVSRYDRDDKYDAAQATESLLSYAEQHHRHTWQIDPPNPTFFRFFRLIGIGDDSDGDVCMHPCGLEFYGQVHED